MNIEELKEFTDESGNINLSYKTIDSLPDGLVVGGSLFLNDATLNGAKIASLSDDALANGEFLFDESFYLNEAKFTDPQASLWDCMETYKSRQ